MKKSLAFIPLVLALPMMASNIAFGDENRPGDDFPPHGHKDKMVEHLAVDLDLTEDQKGKLHYIFSDARRKMHKIHEEQDEKLRLVLTREQYQAFRDLMPPPPFKGEKKHCKLKKGPQKDGMEMEKADFDKPEFEGGMEE